MHVLDATDGLIEQDMSAFQNDACYYWDRVIDMQGFLELLKNQQ